MCSKCKGAIVQMRRITRTHCEDFGVWQSASFRDSFDDDEDIERKIQRTAIESMPHYLVVGGRKRQEERIHQERLQAHFEGTGIRNLQSTDTSASTGMEEQVIRDESIEEMLADFQDTIHFPEEFETPIRGGTHTIV